MVHAKWGMTLCIFFTSRCFVVNEIRNEISSMITNNVGNSYPAFLYDSNYLGSG